jgi:hypothetical protein
MARKSIGETLCLVNLKDPTASVETFIRKTAKEVALSESWYRDAIAGNPELVIAPCREAGIVSSDERWFCWKTEFSIETGSIDVLLLSSYGRVGIVETKLSYNPQVRREVVAQLLDYALSLRDCPYSFFPTVPIFNESPVAAVEDIEESLASGNFLLIIAGDVLDPRAIRLGKEILSQHLTSMWDLAMVDMNLFFRASNGEYLLIPELRGIIQHETRQTIRVTVMGEAPKARIEVERFTKITPDPASQEKPSPWSIDEACKILDEGRNASGVKIFSFFAKHPLIRVEGGHGPTTPTLILYTRATDEKIGTTWFSPKVKQLNLFLRASRLLELHHVGESELIKKFQALGFSVPSGISKDGYIIVVIPWDVSEDKLDGLARFVTIE